MTLDFVIPELHIGGIGTPPLQFFRRGFLLGSSGTPTPTWQDIILKGSTALTLVNAKANSLAYLKAYGDIDIDGTPTPTTPALLKCNNGAYKMVDDELPEGYKRVLGYTCDNNVLWQITDFHLRGSDTVRISFSINAACNVWGCYQGTSATDNYDLYATVSSGGKYLRYGDGTYSSYFAPSDVGKRFDVVYSPTGTSGMPEDSTWTEMEFESANDLLIGSTTLTGTSSKLKGNLYGNFVVDNRLKLIPCERVSDNSLGYYDTYSETFFEPTGTPTSMGYDGSHYQLIVDGITETVQVHGINLLDLSAMTDDYYYTASGVYTKSTGMGLTDYIPIRAGEKITCYMVRSAGTPTIRFNIFNKDKVWQTQTQYSAGSTVAYVVTPTMNGYLRVSALKAGGSSGVDWSTSMIVRGEYTTSTIPEYEAYYNGGTATVQNLLRTGTTYIDIHDITSGHVTRRVGLAVFTGEEAWAKHSSYSIFYLNKTDCLYANGGVGGRCTHFSSTTTSIVNMPDLSSQIRNISGNTDNRYIIIRMNSMATKDDFKNWLKEQYAYGTPVMMAYPLKTNITEHVTAQPLTIQAGTNIIEITQASIDGLELEAKYKAGVEVTVEEIEDAQLSNDVTVTVS